MKILFNIKLIICNYRSFSKKKRIFNNKIYLKKKSLNFFFRKKKKEYYRIRVINWNLRKILKNFLLNKKILKFFISYYSLSVLKKKLKFLFLYSILFFRKILKQFRNKNVDQFKKYLKYSFISTNLKRNKFNYIDFFDSYGFKNSMQKYFDFKKNFFFNSLLLKRFFILKENFRIKKFIFNGKKTRKYSNKQKTFFYKKKIRLFKKFSLKKNLFLYKKYLQIFNKYWYIFLNLKREFFKVAKTKKIFKFKKNFKVKSSLLSKKGKSDFFKYKFYIYKNQFFNLYMNNILKLKKQSDLFFLGRRYKYNTILTIRKILLANYGIGKKYYGYIFNSFFGIYSTYKFFFIRNKMIKKIQYLLRKLFINHELNKKIRRNILNIKLINTYHGLRHIYVLPIRGQRTKTNAGTRTRERKRQKDLREKIKFLNRKKLEKQKLKLDQKLKNLHILKMKQLSFLKKKSLKK